MPACGEGHLGKFFNLLGEHSTYGGNFDLKEVLQLLSVAFEQGSVIVFVSDFLGNKFSVKDYEDSFKILAKKFDLISVILRDPRDEFMPDQDANIVVSDPYTNQSVFFNVKKIKKQYEEYNKEHKENLVKFFKNINSEHLELYCHEPFVKPTIAFFKRRDALFSR